MQATTSTDISFVEDFVNSFNHLSHSRRDLRAARMRELEERGAPTKAPPEPNDDANEFWWGYEKQSHFSVKISQQHWAAPYNKDYLVLTIEKEARFKKLDVIALSAKEDLSFDELKGHHHVLDSVLSPPKDNVWTTYVSVSQAKLSGTVYLHHFFVAKEKPDENSPIIIRKTTQKIFEAGTELPHIENPANVHGVTHSPHPSISPVHIPHGRLTAFNVSSVAAPLVVSAPTPPFNQLFLTLSGQTFVTLNVYLNGTPGTNDYVALADHYPEDAYKYLSNQWQWVSKLNDQTYYTTGTLCYRKVNASLIVADLEALSKYFLFYATKVNDTYQIVGKPVSFSLHKTWMEDSLPQIGHKRLHEIVIPGTHDSGTYDVESKSHFGMNAQAQSLDFPGQLALGIRYFDCRIQNWPKSHPKQPFFFVHGLAWTWTEITDLTLALEAFFRNSRDIVILDFSRFDSFEPADYVTFFNIFKAHPVFGAALITPQEAKVLTINDLFSLGKKLLILSDDEQSRKNFDLGDSINIDGEWGNTSSIETLHTWLTKQIASHEKKNSLWSLQGILTPAWPLPIVPVADAVNPFITKWVEKDWWNKANVVFTDFAAGNNLVNVAISCNKRRSVDNAGTLHWYEHEGWQTGAKTWKGDLKDPVSVGGWLKYKSVFATSEGVIYAISWDGNLHWYQHVDWQNGGKTWKGGHIVGEGGWNAFRFVFATSKGVIYAVTWDGKLRWYEHVDWQTGGKTWKGGHIVDEAGWNMFRCVFATSKGVVYGVHWNGNLYWREHLDWQTGGKTWKDEQVVSQDGWNNFKSAFATSDGVIYAIGWDGKLHWKEHVDWQTGGKTWKVEQVVGDGGWEQFISVFATNVGRIYSVR